jgi:hypothetical protein
MVDEAMIVVVSVEEIYTDKRHLHAFSGIGFG